ncbi:succinate--hydroxymethylglutarate CoA-transferase [Contarinia nasturtii]|uniref:succinate--hydroxymethylglutarate CoA-transferase n=1 Tax=Contarinia nasturtii TaxID=265458 RepID=UPI0012D47CA4|nr:succinate--hydroxymethylglutarate CoA-transferase [Contarinia nasturtii]
MCALRRFVFNKYSHTVHRCFSTKSRPYPLDGIRVLDLTRIVAGPYCTMILSDLGADVIKIERPGDGDESRKWGPPFVQNSTDSVYFLANNRNKRSCCIDLKRGTDILYDLAKKCDVLVENYVPGKLDEYNLGYDHMSQVNPGLIYCSITGYGSVGPYAKRPGYDVIAASVGGLLHITGSEDGPPAKVGVAVTDLATGLYAHGAIMAALIQRMKTGKGQKIDCNLLSTQVASLINVASNYLNAQKEAKRWGTAHESIVPYEAFQTKDGYLTVGTGSDLQFQSLCHYLNIDHIPKDPKFRNNQERVKNRTELISILSEIFAKETSQHWMKLFENAPFPNGPINKIADVFDDPHIKEIGIVKTLSHPTGGEIKVVGPPVTYSDSSNTARTAPPLLGQHTDDVLRNILEYDEQKIMHLRQQKIIQ